MEPVTSSYRDRGEDCRTTGGHVQLPGEILLLADDAVGKHWSPKGVCVSESALKKD